MESQTYYAACLKGTSNPNFRRASNCFDCRYLAEAWVERQEDPSRYEVLEIDPSFPPEDD